jgi:CRP-like cAMP-binding protein
MMAHMLSFDSKAFIAQYSGAIIKLKAGHILYTQGDPANYIYCIHGGKIKISVVSEQGKEAVVALLEPGDLCGMHCLAGQPLYIASAATMTECVVARLDRASVTRALHDGGAFADYFFSYLLSQNIRLQEHLIDHLFNSSEKRLARTLLLLANYGKSDAHVETVIPRIDQQTLAKMVGTTRARVSHFMNKFRRLGFIDYDGDIRVHSSLLNVVLHDPPNAVRPLRASNRPKVFPDATD